MLKIYENGEKTHPLLVPGTDWYIEHKYEGNDVLKFEIPDNHTEYKNIAEEVRIIDGRNRYTVKKIDEHGGYVNVECALDLDDWCVRFWKEFRTTNSTLKEVLDKIMPAGWTEEGAEQITKRDTIEASEGKGLENVVSKDILNKAQSVYSVVFNFDVLRKRVKVINPSEYESSGDYLIEELNLKSIGFVGDSSNIATRLYAYGKKDTNGTPLTFAQINSGKDYIDNHQYSDKIIAIGWSDERYTVAENLLKAAEKKLDELSFPVRSYECDVRNFAENMYMYKVLTLIDKKRKKRTEHRIVSFKEHPEAHYYDVVTLSAIPPKIETSMKSIRAEINERVAASKQIATDAVLDAIDTITGKNGGHVKIEMVGGNPESIKIHHSDGTETIADKSGLKRDGISYLHLIEQGSLEIDIQTGIGIIQLPDSFSGRDISVSISIKKIEPEKDTDILQAVTNSWDYKIESGRVEINSECIMFDISNMKQVLPKAVELYFYITGR